MENDATLVVMIVKMKSYTILNKSTFNGKPFNMPKKKTVTFDSF